MSISEVENLISLLAEFGFGALIGGGIVLLFIKTFIPKYLSEKAKNLATKEDIAEITSKVESVKSDYATILEEVRSNHQLKFAAVEREKNIKKEVYLEAVEAIVRSQNMISNFCNLNMSEQEITSCLSTDAGKIAKVQIVGNPETVKAVSSFMAAVATATLNLMLERSELMLRKNNIQNIEALRGRSQQEVDRYIALMKNLNLEGNSDPRLWETINTSVTYEQNQVTKYNSELDQLWLVQNTEHMNFSTDCMDTFFIVSGLLPNTILSVRSELDLEIAPEDYLAIFNENLDKGKEVFEVFINKVSSKNA